jgi:antitoxin CptB
MLELDQLLVTFLDQGYHSLPEPEQQRFGRLLEYSDQHLLDLLLGKTPPAGKELERLISIIRACTKEE